MTLLSCGPYRLSAAYRGFTVPVSILNSNPYMILHSFFCENVEVFEDDIFVRSLLVTDASLAGLLKSVDRLRSVKPMQSKRRFIMKPSITGLATADEVA